MHAPSRQRNWRSLHAESTQIFSSRDVKGLPWRLPISPALEGAAQLRVQLNLSQPTTTIFWSLSGAEDVVELTCW
jgi:hypothetical protein